MNFTRQALKFNLPIYSLIKKSYSKTTLLTKTKKESIPMFLTIHKLFKDERNPSVKASSVLSGYSEVSNMTPAEYVSSLKSDDEVAAYYGIGLEKKREKKQERVVQIRRVTKVVKGGKQLSFRAVVVSGDKAGQVGVGKQLSFRAVVVSGDKA